MVRPQFSIQNCDLYLGDSREILPQLPSDSFDAIVTDPPYGMGKDFKGNGSDSERAALALLAAVTPELSRLLRTGGLAFVCSGTRLIDRTIEIIKGAGFDFQRLLWIYKPNDCTYPWRGWILTSESILVAAKGHPAPWQGSNYSDDCYQVMWGKIEVPKGSHPSVKPLKIVRDIVSKTLRGGQFSILFLEAEQPR